MAKQKIEDNLFYVIFRRTPTWATAAIVIVSYPVLRYLLPVLTHGSLWALVGSSFAPWLTFAMALFALYAEADKHKRRQLLKQQTSLDTLRDMTWKELELLVGEAYRQQGYWVEEKGGSGPDGGVDVVLRRNGETTLVQCKQWRKHSVSVTIARELYGVMASKRASGGIVVTCGDFTPDALAFARGKPLELVDGKALLELVRQVQGRAAPAQEIPQTPQLVNDASPAPPLCPRCSQPMLKRTARSGANAGSEFWGCPSFPRCRGTRQLQ